MKKLINSVDSVVTDALRGMAAAHPHELDVDLDQHIVYRHQRKEKGKVAIISGGGSDDITRIRRAGNWGLNALVNVLFTTRYTDLCYGYNAFWRHCLDPINLPDIATPEPQWGDGFEIETLINVRVAAHGMKIAEVHSYEANRILGESNLNAVSDGLRVLRTIRREFFALRVRFTRPGAATPEVDVVSNVVPLSALRRLRSRRRLAAHDVSFDRIAEERAL